MSRVSEIAAAETTVTAAEKTLSDLIHKMFHGDREIWYQVGMSEDPSSWVQGKVIGPFNKFNIMIRVPGRSDNQIVDGRSHRLRLDWKDREAA